MLTAARARRPLKHALYGAARALGGFALLRWLNRHRVPVLCYHSVVDVRLPRAVGLGGLHLDARTFAAHMEHVAARYRVLPLEEAVAAVAGGGRRIPERAAVLTFDDGYANNLALAAPVLERLGLPATIFLATDYLDGERLYWWDELALLASRGGAASLPEWGALDLSTEAGVRSALARGHALLAAAPLADRRRLLDALAGALGEVGANEATAALRPLTWAECRAAPSVIRFGGHTASHRLLDSIPTEDALDDLRRCREALRAQLGVEGRAAFCYPQGRWTEAVRSALPSLGFHSAVTASDRPAAEGLLRSGTDPCLVPRIGIGAGMEVPVLAGHAAGLRLLTARLAGRARAVALPSAPPGDLCSRVVTSSATRTTGPRTPPASTT